MASRRQVLLVAAAIAIAIAFLPAPASAEVFMVGDDAGWTLKYPATWTDGKTFKVGDSLMFMYAAGKHTVVEVTGANFKACNAQGNGQLGAWATGSDTVALDRAGRRWFICGVGDHCAQGMKLVVDVVDDSAAPGPSGPVSSAPASVVTGAVSQAAAMAVTAGAVAAAALMF